MPEPRTFKLTIAYDGTGLVGWQRQAEGTSVQGLLEDALTRLTATAGVTVTGAGRTDAGVHARGQVASTTLATRLAPADLQRGANALLPAAVRVLAVETVDATFHARFGAREKRYAYHAILGPLISPFDARYAWHIPYPLDVAAMRAVAAGAAGPPRFRRISVNRVRYTRHRADAERGAARRGTGGGRRHPARPHARRGRLPAPHGPGHRRQPGRGRPRTLAGRADRGDSGLGGPVPGGADGAPARPVPGVGSILLRSRFRMSLPDVLARLPPGSPEALLARQIDGERLPAHVAIIMDGNGRWAAQRHLPRVEGHRSGIASVREAVETSARLGIPVLTLYAFSIENWKRPRTEVSALMALLRRYLRSELHMLMEHGIRFRVVGRKDALSPEIQKELSDAERATAAHTGMQFNIALNYGGRAEIVDAVRAALAAGIKPDEIDEARFAGLLYTAGQPDPDLLIRTSGEMRVSNFLLWQIAYAEIWVTDTLWPDFRARHLFEAIVDFQKRERRYGGVGSTGESDLAGESRKAEVGSRP